MGYLLLSPGQAHEINFGEDMVEILPENGVAVGDRGLSYCDEIWPREAVFLAALNRK